MIEHNQTSQGTSVPAFIFCAYAMLAQNSKAYTAAPAARRYVKGVKLKKLIFVFVLLSSTQVLAEQWTSLVTIEWLRAYPGDSHSHYLKISDSSRNDGCETTASTGILNINDSGGRLYSAALAATMSKTKVQFWLSGCTSSGYAQIKEIHITGSGS